MTLFLLGKDLVLGGHGKKIEDKQVPGIYPVSITSSKVSCIVPKASYSNMRIYYHLSLKWYGCNWQANVSLSSILQ